MLLKNTRTVESSSEDLRKQAREEQQVSDFDQPAQWKPNGANETDWHKSKIQWIPNGANEAVLVKVRIRRIPNGANEAVFHKFSLQWIPNGANEAAMWFTFSLHRGIYDTNETMSSFFHLTDF